MAIENHEPPHSCFVNFCRESLISKGIKDFQRMSQICEEIAELSRKPELCKGKVRHLKEMFDFCGSCQISQGTCLQMSTGISRCAPQIRYFEGIRKGLKEITGNLVNKGTTKFLQVYKGIDLRYALAHDCRFHVQNQMYCKSRNSHAIITESSHPRLMLIQQPPLKGG